MRKLFLLLAACLPAFGGATLTISAGGNTIVVGGKSMTLVIGGCSTPLSPASGITGFTVHRDSATISQASATSSGCTVTITFLGTVLSTDTITVDLATSASSNLTDAGANTPTGQNGIAVNTNNSGVSGAGYCTYSGGCINGTFTLTSTLISDFGEVSVGSSSGHHMIANVGATPESDFTFSGVNADVMWNTAGGAKVSIDGGAFSSFSSCGSSWCQTSVSASDLSNATHTVKFIRAYEAIDAVVKVSGTGLVSNSNYGTVYVINGDLADTYNSVVYPGAVDGCGLKVNASGYTNIWQWTGVTNTSTEGSVRFQVSGGNSIGLWSYDGSPNNYVFVNGVNMGSLGTTSVANEFRLHMLTGLTLHNGDVVEVPYFTLNGAAAFSEFYQVMVGGGTILSTTQPVRPCMGWYGDSIVAQIQISDATQGAWWLASRAIGGLAPSRFGISGTCVSNAAGCSGSAQSTTTTFFTGQTVVPKIMVFEGGTNDISNGASQSIFTSAYQSMLTTPSTLMPAGAVFLAQEPFYRGNPDSTRQTYGGYIKNAVAAYMGGSPAVPAFYIDTVGWTTTCGVPDYYTDCLHPLAPGYAKIAVQMAPVWNAAANYRSIGWWAQ